MESPIHVLLLPFPAQGHINPFLRLANLLAAQGILVTFSINRSTTAMIRLPPANRFNPSDLIRFNFFDDGLSLGELGQWAPLEQLMPLLERTGRKALPGIIESHAAEGRPVNCLVSDPYLPWAYDVAAAQGVLFAALWTQSAASFSAHFYSLRGGAVAAMPTADEPESDAVFPSMPVLKHDEIPTFLHPATPHPLLVAAVVAEPEFVDNVMCILMDTFAELEPEIVEHVSTICRVVPVGPLCLQPTICGETVNATDGCIDWLDRKGPSTVVYVSMGTIAVMAPQQRDELAYGLVESGLPFLWSVRPNRGEDESSFILPDDLGAADGKVVRWAPQREVLAHPAVACFVTHCGWNSTLEAVAAGKPVVAWPQWGDQVTNAKFLVDVFEVGVRLSRGATEFVKRDDVARCLSEAVVGPKAEGLRRNAARWKEAAEKAVAKGGAGEGNVKKFVEMVKEACGKKSVPRDAE